MDPSETPQVIIPPFQPTNPPPEPEPQLSEFAQGVLKDIPDNDRATVAKYLPTWDGNVTKKFQEYSEKLKPYEELGDYENLQSSLYYQSLLQEDPTQFVRTVIQAMKETGMSLDDLWENDDESQQQPPVGGNPLQARIDELEQMVSNMHQEFQGYASQENERQQLNALDNLLEDMHHQHGDYDEDYILLQLERGASPDEAMQAWHQSLEKFGSQRRPAPQLLTGNGAVRNDQVDPLKMSKEDRKAWAVQALEANR
jgi:hypothetical protein